MQANQSQFSFLVFDFCAHNNYHFLTRVMLEVNPHQIQCFHLSGFLSQVRVSSKDTTSLVQHQESFKTLCRCFHGLWWFVVGKSRGFRWFWGGSYSEAACSALSFAASPLASFNAVLNGLYLIWQPYQLPNVAIVSPLPTLLAKPAS